jgi:hypothetical protein
MKTYPLRLGNENVIEIAKRPRIWQKKRPNEKAFLILSGAGPFARIQGKKCFAIQKIGAT